MAHTIIVHTASVRLKGIEQIIIASLKSDDVRKEVKGWREKHPGRRVKYRTIIEKVES